MNKIFDYIKNHVLGSVIVFLFTVTTAGIWSLVILVWNLPDRVETNFKEQTRLALEFSDYKSAIQKELDDLREADKSQNRRITNNQTEIFYLLMGKQKPTQQNK